MKREAGLTPNLRTGVKKCMKKNQKKVSKKVSVLVLNTAEYKVAKLIKETISKVDTIKNSVQKEAHAASTLFVKAVEALATVEVAKRNMVLLEAGVDKKSSYFSSVKRAALDVVQTKKLLADTGSINKTIALLPHAASEDKPKRGRPTKTPEQKDKEKTMKYVVWLVQKYQLKDLIKLIEQAAKQLPKAATDKDDADEFE